MLAITSVSFRLLFASNHGMPRQLAPGYTEATGLCGLPSQLHSTAVQHRSTHRDSRIVFFQNSQQHSLPPQPHKPVACHNSRMFA